jgi:hypothetical protein
MPTVLERTPDAGAVRGIDHVDRFRAHAGLIVWDEDALARVQLAPDLARILHVAALLEEDTTITTRQGSSLGLDRFDDLAAFLPQWALEEDEHGRALRALLSHQVYEPPACRPASVPHRRRLVARMPVHLLGRVPSVPFVFCVLGAAAEYVATSLYAELAGRAATPPVEQLLRSIARQEARHFAFFLAAARLRGDAMSDLEGLLSRKVLGAVWEPIGVPTLGRAAWLETFADWLDDEHLRHRLEMMDRVVDSVPHLAGMHLMGTFLRDVT